MIHPECDTIGVWVIEDDPGLRNGLRELIRTTAGMRCDHAFTRAEEALEAIKGKDPPEVMLVDIGLPGMSGIEGIRQMKMVSPGTEFIVLTIHEERESVFDAICAGATGYLVKNLPPEAILEKIREAARGGAPIDPLIARRVLEILSGAEPARGDYGLTEREMDVLTMMVQGMTRLDIAEKLFVSPATINTHSRNIYEKLHVHTRGSAVAKALKERLV
jgi:DNA-binding NarL/FixJ family response regulator